MFFYIYLLTASLYCLFPRSDKPYSMSACYTHSYTSSFTLVLCFRQQSFIRWCVPLVQSGHLYPIMGASWQTCSCKGFRVLSSSASLSAAQCLDSTHIIIITSVVLNHITDSILTFNTRILMLVVRRYEVASEASFD